MQHLKTTTHLLMHIEQGHTPHTKSERNEEACGHTTQFKSTKFRQQNCG